MRKFIASISLFIFLFVYATNIFLSIANGGAVAEGTSLATDTTLARIVNIFILILSIFSCVFIAWTGFLKKKYFYAFLFFCLPYFYTLIQCLFLNNFERTLIIMTYPFILYLALFINDKFGINYLLRLFLFNFLIILIISLIMVLFFPSYGVSIGTHEGAWQGMFLHKNAFGFFIFIFSSILLIYFKSFIQNKILLIFLLSLILVLSILVKSSTSILLISYLLVYVLFIGLKTNKIVNSFSSPFRFFCIFVFFLFIMIGSSSLFSYYLEKDAGFSNRDIIWLSGFNLFFASPIFGSGYSSSEIFSKTLFSAVYAEISSFHNSYIDILVYFGLVGIMIFFMIFFIILNDAKKNGFIYYGILFPFLLYMFFESLIFGQTISMLYLFLIHLYSKIHLNNKSL